MSEKKEMTLRQLWCWGMRGKRFYNDRRATAVLTEDFVYLTYTGERKEIRILPKGTKVKVVMFSRMGNVGITMDLEAEHGYIARVQCVPYYTEIAGKEVEYLPEDVLGQIMKVS